MQTAFTHDAFISYSRKDIAFVSRLEQTLEAYTPPKEVNRSRRHLDVFRDTNDFETGDYHGNLEKHLSASRKLIVVCSPNSRASEYVNEEIERFVASRGAGNVIPLLVSGLPNSEARVDQEHEKAFPQALCQAVEMPLAAEYRGFDSAKNGFDKGVYYGAWYSVLASLFEVTRGEIEQRDAKRRARIRRTWMSGVGMIIVVLSALTAWALIERKKAIEQARTALSRQLAAESSNLFGSNLRELSLLLAIAAYRIDPTVESRSSLLDSLAGHGYLKAYSATDNGSHVLSVAFSPDGKTLAFGTRAAKIFLLDAASGTQRAVLSDHRSWVWGLAFSPDGKTLVSGSWDKTLILWDVASGRAIGQPLTGHVGEVKSVAISPDGKTVVSGSWDKTVILWDVASHQPIGEPLRGHTDRVSGVAFSPDGKTIASCGDKTIILWDAASRQPIGSPLEGGFGAVLSVAFSPDGRMLASGSEGNVVTLWDLASRRSIGSPLQRHNGAVLTVAFSPDGKLLASGGEDNKIILWDVANMEPRVVLSGQAGTQQGNDKGRVRGVAFGPDGKTVASAGNQLSILLWRVDIDTWPYQACAIANRNLTREEWRTHIGDALPYQAVCEDLPMPK